MDITHYLAMTGAEFAAAETLPQHVAWMSCHYSAGGSGLSNLPQRLPPDSLVVIDDSIPPSGHDTVVILTQLTALLQAQQFKGILLDFQRPDLEENATIASCLVKNLPCPVCVSSLYAKKLECPVFLPSPPLHCLLEQHLSPWQGREIWLEVALEAETITVTEAGSQVSPLSRFDLPELPFEDTGLCCRYKTEVLTNRIVFTLARDQKMVNKLLKTAEKQGISCAVSLYQQLQCYGNTG